MSNKDEPKTTKRDQLFAAAEKVGVKGAARRIVEPERTLGEIMDRALRRSSRLVPDPAADRMALAIEAAMPLIRDMWGQFPYAEQPGDDEVMTELRESAAAYRRLQIEPE